METPTPFTPETVAAIIEHMNNDHAADTLAICRGPGRQPATAARVVDMGANGLELEATVDGRPHVVHVSWIETPTDRPGIRQEIIRLCEAAEV